MKNLKQYLIKAKIRDKPEGSNRIRKHIFAADEVTARNKFRVIYDEPENLDWEEIEFLSIEEVKDGFNE